MPIETKKLDVADWLETDEDVLGFLEELAEIGSPKEFLHGLRTAACSKGMTTLAENMGVNRNVSEHISVARTLRAKTAAYPIKNDEINKAKNAGRL